MQTGGAKILRMLQCVYYAEMIFFISVTRTLIPSSLRSLGQIVPDLWNFQTSTPGRCSILVRLQHTDTYDPSKSRCPPTLPLYPKLGSLFL